MEETMLGKLKNSKPALSGLRRLKTIKLMFERLSMEHLSQSDLTDITSLSHSGVRKNLRVFWDAKLIYRTNPEAKGNIDSLFTVVDNDELVAKFAEELDDLIQALEDHLSGAKPMAYDSSKKKDKGSKVEHGKLFDSHEYAPGRRIYTARG